LGSRPISSSEEAGVVVGTLLHRIRDEFPKKVETLVPHLKIDDLKFICWIEELELNVKPALKGPLNAIRFSRPTIHTKDAVVDLGGTGLVLRLD